MTGGANHSRGFTLVELLVAASITVVIVVLLGTMFTSIAATASRANQRTDAFRDARAALQMMTRDFRSVIRTRWEPDPYTNPPPPPSPAPQARTRPVSYLALKNLISVPLAPQQLYGLVAIKNSSPGDLCSVGYYCSWDGKAFSLRRYFRNSKDTYDAIAASASYASETDLFKPDPAKDDLLAQYVWDMRVVGFDANGASMPYPYVCDASAGSPTQPPASIEISFRAISPQAARTVMSVTSNPDDWDPNKNTVTYQRLVKPHAYQFRTRLEL